MTLRLVPVSDKPIARRNVWWDTNLCRALTLEGMMAGLWVRHFFPTLGLRPDNDRDHIKW